MTSTNTFQGMDTSTKPSSRVLRPPEEAPVTYLGGGDETVSTGSRANKMASTIFGPPDEALACPKRTNPPGGKSSGIFAEAVKPTPQQRPVPAGGVSSNIFGEAVSNPPTVRSHPNKPKDNIGVNATPQPEVPKQVEKPVENASAPSTPSKEDTPKQQADPSPCQPPVDNHEPRLGPRPRSHNKVIHPPGGKSSVAFY